MWFSVRAMRFVLGGLLLALAAFLAVRSWRWRHRQLTCAKCGKPRVKLDEEADDHWLDAGQRCEEQLGSMNYDAWWCAPCEDVVVLRNKLFRPSFVPCERCRRVTANEVLETVRAASPEHGGEFKVHLHCGHCGHTQRFWRYTPRASR